MKVYKYGALKPTSGADTADAQLRAANMYRRALRDIEIGRRVAIRGLTRDNDLKIVALEAGIACKRGELETLGGQLHAMLGLAGFRQALVVSHDARSVSALPGRILVTGVGEYSKVEVVG